MCALGLFATAGGVSIITSEQQAAARQRTSANAAASRARSTKRPRSSRPLRHAAGVRVRRPTSAESERDIVAKGTEAKQTQQPQSKRESRGNAKTHSKDRRHDWKKRLSDTTQARGQSAAMPSQTVEPEPTERERETERERDRDRETERQRERQRERERQRQRHRDTETQR